MYVIKKENNESILRAYKQSALGKTIPLVYNKIDSNILYIHHILSLIQEMLLVPNF